jgi:site-specific DNA-methyltransferase (adenine-specific)
MTARILEGDCRDVLRTLDAESFDSVVTDPPYGINFMGKAWDRKHIIEQVERRAGQAQPLHRDGSERRSPRRALAEEAGAYDLSPAGMRAFQNWTAEWAEQAFRVLKPGGFLLCFASTRTYHRMACGLEDAGFEIRDQIGWLFGSGFPKNRDFAKDHAASKAAGQRIVLAEFVGHPQSTGWGTALKPGWEPIAVARKPFKGPVGANVLKHGTGALNISGCFVGETDDGRWPANVVHDGSDEVLAAFPTAPGQQGDLTGQSKERKSHGIFGDMPAARNALARGDSGSAARFFYCAKASKADREAGCEGLPVKRGGMVSNTSGQHITRRDGGEPGERANHHPTVKPTALMRWLCRLVTPPGGIILDPFAGSGSTGRAADIEGFSATLIEEDAEYAAIARNRISGDAPLFAEVAA